MLEAFAPRMPRGLSWAWLAILLVAVVPSSPRAQGVPPTTGDKKPADKPKPAAKADDPDEGASEEVFVDPNARKALAVFNPLTYSGQLIRIGNANDDRARVQAMASGAQGVDPDFLKRYVEYLAVELTKRENLNAILNPPAAQKPLDRQARALETAVDALNKPIIDGKANNNREFLATYQRTLFESPLPKLLEANHNYLSRIDAMIVLGMAGNPNPYALELYIAQLKKADQLVWVKLWAARGLSIAAQNGEINLEAGKANAAAEALMGFLDSDPKLPWPAQMRSLEALGSLRVASANTVKGKLDVASVAMKFLADPDGSPIVRAWAAWALGMMKVPSNVVPYNFTLVGQEIGELAVELGNLIVEEHDEDPANFDKKKDEASQLTSLLLFEVYPALVGQDKPLDSGLLRSQHSNAVDAKDFLKKLDDRIKAVSRQAYELIRAGGAGNLAARNELDAKVADLKTLLAGTSVKDRHLVPGGPEFAPSTTQQVAGARVP